MPMSTEPLADSELMAQLAGNHDLALNELMDRWGARVNAFLFKMTGRREVALDLTQETFVKLYQARKRYRSSGNFSTYLFTIAANLARNHARWRKRHPTVSLNAGSDDENYFNFELSDSGIRPDQAADVSERYEQVQRSLLTLPLDLRETMILFIYEGMSYMEIAKVMKCSVKAVETRIYRARTRLRLMLNRD